MADAAALWRKALETQTPLADLTIATFCLGDAPSLFGLTAQARRVASWDWRFTARHLPREGLAEAPRAEGPEAAVTAWPWNGSTATLPSAVADLALLDLDNLPGRDSFVQAIRGASTVLRPGGRLLLRAGNTNGVGGATRRLREWFGTAEPVAYGGGHRVLVAVHGRGTRLPPPPPASWHTVQLAGMPLRVRQTPGVFAEGLLDPGTRLLAEAAARVAAGSPAPTARACDLCCGTGLASLPLLALGRGAWTLVDDDRRALEAASTNLAVNARAARTRILAADASAGLPGGPYDLIVCNPPFHRGTQTDHRLTADTLQAGRSALAPGGMMLAVAMRFLPLERWLPDAVEVASDGAFRVLAVTRPAAERSAGTAHRTRSPRRRAAD